MKLAIYIAVLGIFILGSCNDSKKRVQNSRKPIDVKKDMVDYKDTLKSSEFDLIKKIGQNSDDLKDSLVNLAESAMGITIESLGEEAWVINMWYGGSYEDIFIYKKKQQGTYERILWVSGAISFKVQTLSDDGLKRVLIKNNRNRKMALFVYNGTDYSSYLDQGFKRSLKNPFGISTLKEMEIYNEMNY
nr:hypothetical protein [uncultured Fluviicola sp.]